MRPTPELYRNLDGKWRAVNQTEKNKNKNKKSQQLLPPGSRPQSDTHLRRLLLMSTDTTQRTYW